MNALVLIDLQNDFMPGGALAVKGGDTVVPVANRLLDLFDIAVTTQDWHPADHGSFITAHPGASVGDVVKLGNLDQVVWPVHCVQHTSGAALHEQLEASRLTKGIYKGTDSTMDSYSGFFDNDRRRATDLEATLNSLGVTRIFIMGLATDYCVKYTALDARRLGFETVLLEDGCRGVNLNPGDSESAIRDMSNAGVVVKRSQALDT